MKEQTEIDKARAMHRKETRRRRAEKFRARQEQERVERLMRQLTNKELDERFEYAIEKQP
jgi:hypothetical protein